MNKRWCAQKNQSPGGPQQDRQLSTDGCLSGAARRGCYTLGRKYAGVASGLRRRFLEIRTRQRDWPTVTAMQVDEFIRQPSKQSFTDCRKSAEKVNAWPGGREGLLEYLETGKRPWKKPEWSLPETGLGEPEANPHERFPRVARLIDIAILEKQPDKVLHWYDRLSLERSAWQHAVDADRIATAVKTFAPERAVVIWKNRAESLIAQVNPSAYQEAAVYLRKAGQVMTSLKTQAEWDRYLQELRRTHARKIRLIEVLDGLEGKPILKKRR